MVADLKKSSNHGKYLEDISHKQVALLIFLCSLSIDICRYDTMSFINVSAQEGNLFSAAGKSF